MKNKLIEKRGQEMKGIRKGGDERKTKDGKGMRKRNGRNKKKKGEGSREKERERLRGGGNEVKSCCIPQNCWPVTAVNGKCFFLPIEERMKSF